MRVLAEPVTGISNPLEKLRAVSDFLDAEANPPLPDIDRFPIHYCEVGGRSIDRREKK